MKLKYRAWDSLYGKMFFSDKLSEFFHAVEQRPKEQEPIVMAWTGLLDKNGKEIYEGDVVRESDRKNWEVKFDPEYGGFYPFTYCSDGMGYECGTVKGENSEIIGNIYENPDLLTNLATH